MGNHFVPEEEHSHVCAWFYSAALFSPTSLLGRKTGENEFEYLSMRLGGRESTKILRDRKNVQVVCAEYLE